MTPGFREICFLSQNRARQTMGMGHYERLLLSHLSNTADPHLWKFRTVFDGRKPAVVDEPLRRTPHFEIAYSGFSSSRLARIPFGVGRAVMTVPRSLRGVGFYHALALTIPVPARKAYVLTIHDLPPARFRDEGALPGWSGRAAACAQAILTPSEFGKREIVELLGVSEKLVHVVANGCEHDRFHAGVERASGELLASLGLQRPFLLYSGGATTRKNVASLLAAWGRIANRFEGLSLALAGPEAALQEIVDRSGARNVTVVGYLDRERMPAVMKAAEAVVVPSIYEGFGLPPLEAMALGVPVVAVKAGAIPEVVGDCAVLSPDGSPEAIAESLELLLCDSALAAELARNGPSRAALFSWDKHARQVLRIYEDSFC